MEFVQNITEEQAYIVEEAFKNTDLLIYQIIADTYKIPKLSTLSLMQHRKADTMNISFPSLYFNAYFPHLDMYNGKKSILRLVHDYIIMYSYVLGLSEQEIIDLIQSEDLYPKDIIISLLDQSFKSLRKKESNRDVKISNFIEQNFKDIKLFNQFNHPKGIVFDHIANIIFNILDLDTIEESIHSRTSLDGIMTPIYRSTYKNLDLTFKEDFLTYSTVKGKLQQDEVISEFLKTYKLLNKDDMLQTIQIKKPFIINIFKKLGI